MLDNSTRFSRYAGLVVCIFSTLFVGAVLFVLFTQIHLIEEDLPDPVLNPNELVCATEDCSLEVARLAIETDVFARRYLAVKSAMSSRLMIFVTAEIIALTLIVLGGVLIFDRIRGSSEKIGLSSGAPPPDPSQPEQSAASTGIGWSVFLGTTFPGVMLCAFATGILAFALHLSNQVEAKIKINDSPVFPTAAVALEDPASLAGFSVFNPQQEDE